VRVLVRLFARHREAVGVDRLVVELPTGATVATLAAELAHRYPVLAAGIEAVRFAINRQYAATTTPLSDGDEVAVIPPVAGGGEAEARIAPERPFQVVDHPIDPAEVVRRVEHPGNGAICVFFGVVRNRALSGRATSFLEYEAYPEMAEAKMAEIAAEIQARWGIERIAITHRVGRLAVGEPSVIIAVGSAHRREAFEACRYAIDRLKEEVPIWKKEIGPDGEAWVE